MLHELWLSRDIIRCQCLTLDELANWRKSRQQDPSHCTARMALSANSFPWYAGTPSTTHFWFSLLHHPALLSHFCKRWRGKIVMGSKLNLSPPRISLRCPSPCRSEGRWIIAKALCANSVSFHNNQPHGKLLHQSMELDFKSVKRNFATIKSRKSGGGTAVFRSVRASWNTFVSPLVS